MAEVSTKPYLIRAIHEWCVDNGYTPYLSVSVNKHTLVPKEHIEDGEIVLNASPIATNKLKLGNDWIQFQARFGGNVEDILIPVGQVSAIYAQENGDGMAFEVFDEDDSMDEDDIGQSGFEESDTVATTGKSFLKAVEFESLAGSDEIVEKNDNNSEKSTKNSPTNRKNHLTRIK